MTLSRIRKLSAGMVSLLAVGVFLIPPFVIATHDTSHDHSVAEADECAVCSFFSLSFACATPDHSNLHDSGAASRFEISDDVIVAINIVADHPTRAPPQA
jgi:hypothetical protein